MRVQLKKGIIAPREHEFQSVRTGKASALCTANTAFLERDKACFTVAFKQNGTRHTALFESLRKIDERKDLGTGEKGKAFEFVESLILGAETVCGNLVQADHDARILFKELDERIAKLKDMDYYERMADELGNRDSELKSLVDELFKVVVE